MNSRLETFCDGVFAIAITLLILELKVPPLDSVNSISDVWNAVLQLWPSFFALCFSFTIIFISWIGHHNLLKHIDKSSHRFLAANGFFLFTVIIIPFPTSFMAEYLDTPYAQPAIVFYSICSILHNVGWIFLNSSIKHPVSLVKNDAALVAVNKAADGAKYGFFLYSLLTILAIWQPYISIAINALTWIFWGYLIFTIREDNKALS